MDRLQRAVALAKEKNQEVIAEKAAASSAAEADLDYANISVMPVSDERLAEQRVVAGLAGFPELQTFKLLRTKVLSKMRENNWRTIAVSSPKHGQGRSTIAANLAVAMAMDVTQSVVLVDLNLREPSLHKAFSLDVKAGLAEVLTGEASLSDVLVNPGIARLTILPGHGTLSNSSERLSDPKMMDLFKEFSVQHKSRFVIYDMPPILDSDDVLKTIKNFDCSLLVVEDGENSSAEVRESLHVMRQTNFLGYVLNKSDIRFSLGAE